MNDDELDRPIEPIRALLPMSIAHHETPVNSSAEHPAHVYVWRADSNLTDEQLLQGAIEQLKIAFPPLTDLTDAEVAAKIEVTVQDGYPPGHVQQQQEQRRSTAQRRYAAMVGMASALAGIPGIDYPKVEPLERRTSPARSRHSEGRPSKLKVPFGKSIEWKFIEARKLRTKKDNKKRRTNKHKHR